MAEPTKIPTGQYLAPLPADRRALLAAVRALVVRHLPPGFVESATPLDALDADAIAEAIALTPDQFSAEHEAARAR